MQRTLLVVVAVVLLCASVFATPVKYQAFLYGSNENPPTSSHGSGYAIITLDLATNLMTVDVTFSGLTGNTTASHIHCCALPPTNAGVATQTPTFSGFPLGVTSGTYSNTFDMSLAGSWNAP